MGRGPYRRGSGAGFSPTPFITSPHPHFITPGCSTLPSLPFPWGARAGEEKKFKSVELGVGLEETPGTPGEGLPCPSNLVLHTQVGAGLCGPGLSVGLLALPGRSGRQMEKQEPGSDTVGAPALAWPRPGPVLVATDVHRMCNYIEWGQGPTGLSPCRILSISDEGCGKACGAKEGTPGWALCAFSICHQGINASAELCPWPSPLHNQDLGGCAFLP